MTYQNHADAIEEAINEICDRPYPCPEERGACVSIIRKHLALVATPSAAPDYEALRAATIAVGREYNWEVGLQKSPQEVCQAKWDALSALLRAKPEPKPAPAASRPGDRCIAEHCALFKPTGVCCPHDSCDLETGARTTPAPVADAGEAIQPEELSGLEAEANHRLGREEGAIEDRYVLLYPPFALRLIREHRRLTELARAPRASLADDPVAVERAAKAIRQLRITGHANDGEYALAALRAAEQQDKQS